MNSSRRNFLSAAGALAVSGGWMQQGIASVAEPPVRPEGSLLKLSLAGYSFHRMFARRGTPEQIAAARLSLESFIEWCAEQGLSAVELTGYYFPKDVTTEYLLNIRQMTHRLGLAISGTAIGNDFCLPEGSERQAQLKECRQWIDYASIMGAPAIRIFAGKVPAGDTEAAAIERCVAGINECLGYASTKGVFLALENHGGITATPEQMMKIISAVDDSPWFGVNFDSGNFHTDDPYRDLAVIAPYAVNAQIKVSVSRNDRKEQADLQRIIRILQDARYRGYVALEYEESEDPFVAVPRHLKTLRELMG